MTVTAVPVRSARDRRDFVALPQRVYGRDARWIAPPAASVRHAMDPGRNPFHREAAIEHFIARDARGTCVGRIAAIIHPAHIRRHGTKAFFGCFELIDDVTVARSLLAKVEAWAEERGIRIVQGPCSYAMTQEAGLLLDGYEQPPALLQPYNPAYYGRLLREAGYEVAFHMSTFQVARGSAAVTEAIRRGGVATAQLGLTARPIDMTRFDEELERIRVCYNLAFAAHPETAAISREVFAEQAGEMKAIVDPRLVRVVEREGVPVAFSVAVPNVFEILAPTQGRLSLGLILRWRQLMKRVRSMVVIMIGGDPEVSELRAGSAVGMGSCLAAQVGHALDAGPYHTVHTTWIHEDNWRAQALMRAIGAKRTRRYGIFERSAA